MAMTRRTVLVAATALATISRAGFAAAAGKGRSIVIFYSRTGTIKGLAQSVAELTGADEDGINVRYDAKKAVEGKRKKELVRHDERIAMDMVNSVRPFLEF